MTLTEVGLQRYPHFLAPITKASYPTAIVAVHTTSDEVDTDANGTRRRARLCKWFAAAIIGKGGHYGKAHTWQGTEYESFWSGLEKLTSRIGLTYVYGFKTMHHLSLLNAWQMVEQGRLRLSGMDARNPQQRRKLFGNLPDGMAIMEDPPTIVQLSDSQGSHKTLWLDCRNHGVDIGSEPDEPLVWVSVLVEWLRRAILILRDNQLGGWKTTAGSQAVASWRYAAMTTPVYCHVNDAALSLERKAYYGGRCEVFRHGRYKETIYHLDFRSLYPYCCSLASVPVRLVGVNRGSDVGSGFDVDGTSTIIADVTVRVDKPVLPCRRNGVICWPVGVFRAQVCEPELDLLQGCGAVLTWHTVAAYETDNALSAFALQWYRIRCDAEQSGDRLSAAWAKSVMVCLVGKLGQRQPSWISCQNAAASAPWECWHTLDCQGRLQRWRSINWHVQREHIEPNAPESVPSIAAHITSMGRARLWKALVAAGCGNVFYSDTDSLITNREGYCKLIDSGLVRSGEWGMLQVKGIHDEGEFLGVKHYLLDGILKCSGMPQSAGSTGTEPGTVWRNVKVASALRNAERPEAERVLRSYNRVDNYPLGVVMPNGFVQPFHLRG